MLLDFRQHNLDFGENFDFRKLNQLPGFGVRVRNCNDYECGHVMCDATYTYDPSEGVLKAYWAKFNTIYGPDNVGCVTHAVQGNAWKPAHGVHKYTRFEYYPIDTNGRDTSVPLTAGAFDASKCRLIKRGKPAVHGTGANPAKYVCTPTGAAEHLQNTLQFVEFSAHVDSTTTATTAGGAGTAVAAVVASICLLSLTVAALVIVIQKYRQSKVHESQSAEDTSNEKERTPGISFITHNDCDVQTL